MAAAKEEKTKKATAVESKADTATSIDDKKQTNANEQTFVESYDAKEQKKLAKEEAKAEKQAERQGRAIGAADGDRPQRAHVSGSLHHRGPELPVFLDRSARLGVLYRSSRFSGRLRPLCGGAAGKRMAFPDG